jgi:hypothetical protein
MGKSLRVKLGISKKSGNQAEVVENFGTFSGTGISQNKNGMGVPRGTLSV